MSRSVAIFDLDRGLLTGSIGPVLQAQAGGTAKGALVRVTDTARRLMDAVGGPVGGEFVLGLALRAASGSTVDELRGIGAAAATDVVGLVGHHALPVIDSHREEGRRLVLTSVLPAPLCEPIAEALRFDAVIATRMRETDGRLDGAADGPVVWGRGKLAAVRSWAADNGASLRRSYAYAGSFRDAPLLAEVGRPTVVDPDPRLAVLAWMKGWPTRYFDAPPGVIKVWGQEIQELGRPLARPELVPFARFEFEGLENIPSDGPAIVCGNHRSYFDGVPMALALAQRGRSTRFLGKKEVFDVPVVGNAARWIGGIRVDRGTGSDEPLMAAATALESGEAVMIMPEGTIPRGPAFFEPKLKGRWGTARLAAMTKAPVIPIGLWGTEKVWPRSSRLPNLNPLRRPLVTVRAGPPVELTYRDADEDTARIMSAISALLPAEARKRRKPTEAELRLTYPAGYKGDPEGETARRPGTDTMSDDGSQNGASKSRASRSGNGRKARPGKSQGAAKRSSGSKAPRRRKS